MDADGTVRTVKDYLPGIKNTIPSSLKKASGGELIISGRVTTEKGNEAGWIFKVMTDGNLVFNVLYTQGWCDFASGCRDSWWWCGCNRWCYSCWGRWQGGLGYQNRQFRSSGFSKNFDRKYRLYGSWSYSTLDDGRLMTLMGCNADQFRRAENLPFGDIISGRSGFGR